MAFTHYKIGARSGAVWSATQMAFKYIGDIKDEDIILFTGTPDSRMLRICEKSAYHAFCNETEIPAGIQEMRILCDYKAVEAIYETDTAIGTLVWNKTYWAEKIEYEYISTITLLLARAMSGAGFKNVDKLSSSRGVVVDLKKTGNIAEFSEDGINSVTGWAGTHLFSYLTIDYALHDRLINKAAYGPCINVAGPWATYFSGLKEFQNNISPSKIAEALEAEVERTFGVKVQNGNVVQLLRDIPNDVITKAASNDFIRNGGRDKLYAR